MAVPIPADQPAEAYRRILAVTGKLLTPIDLPSLLSQIVDIACALLDADRATVFIYDREPDELFSVAARGIEEIRFPAGVGIAGATLASRQIINVPDCYADDRFNTDIDKATHYRTSTLLSVPMVGDNDEAVGVLQVLNKAGGAPFGPGDEELAQLLAVQSALAVARALLVADRMAKQKFERDLKLASDIQRRTLPTTLPQTPGYDIAGWAEAADETGGDTYDVFTTPEGRVAVVLGDATGHGIAPALSVTQFRSMLRTAMGLEVSLDRAVKQINAQLTADLPPERFITAFLGLLDTAAHEIAYQSAGQGPLVYYSAAEQTCAALEVTSFPLGLMEMDLPEPVRVPLGVGDVLLLCSDGVYEYLSPVNEQFGVERVEAVLCESRDASAAGLIDRIRAAVDAFAEGAPQLDDITMLVVKRTA